MKILAEHHSLRSATRAFFGKRFDAGLSNARIIHFAGSLDGRDLYSLLCFVAGFANA